MSESVVVGTKHARIARYAAAYEANFDFEGVLVAARRRTVLEFLSHRRPHVVVEAGCGTELLCARTAELGLPFEWWVVVEPSSRFAALANSHASTPPGARVTVVQAFLEDSVDQVMAVCGPADVVICSSVLHEVDDPVEFLTAARRMLAEDGLLYVDVPNARSLHRRLARAMGLIGDEAELSARNRTLGQPRVYDIPGVCAVVEAAGFDVVDRGGYFVKPFTNAQMADIGFVDGALLDGLWTMGRELPDLAAEIFCVAGPRPA